MKKEDLSKKERVLFLRGYHKGILTIVQYEGNKRYQLFCQDVTVEELTKNYQIKDKQLIKCDESVNDDNIANVPDCAKKLELLLIEKLELLEDEILDGICEVNSTSDCQVCILIGGAIMDFDSFNDTEFIFTNEISDSENAFIIPKEESSNIEEMVKGYDMTNILDGFYNTVDKTVGIIDGGCIRPMIYYPYTEETSGNTTAYKLLRAIVDDPTEITEVEMDSPTFQCSCGNNSHIDGIFPSDMFGFPEEPTKDWKGFYTCERCRKVYLLNN